MDGFANEETEMTRVARALFTVMMVGAAVGCAQPDPMHRAHWEKPGSTHKDYRADVQECAANGLESNAIRDGGWTSADDAIQTCMGKNGWHLVR
jgi:hypothetical protein